jgi:WD40 repeat protein
MNDLEQRVAELEPRGRIDRARREIEAFAALCPREGLAASALHDRVMGALASDEAPGTLIAGGLEAKARGLPALAQMLLDRGLVALERQVGAKATADVHRLGAVGGIFLRMQGPSFSKDGSVFAAGHGPHVSVYSSATGRERMRLTHPRLALAEVHATEITPDGAVIAHARRGKEHLRATWSLATGEIFRVEIVPQAEWEARVNALESLVRSVSTEPPEHVPDARVSTGSKGDLVLSVPVASDEGHRERPEAVLLDTRTGRSKKLASLRADAVREVRITESALVVAGDQDASWSWDLATGRPTGHVVPGDPQNIMHPFVQAISSDGDTVTNRDDETLELWSIRQGARIASLGGHQKASQYRAAIDAVDFSPDGAFAATGDDTGTVRVFHRDGRLVRMIDAADDDISALAWSPDGRLLATATDGEAALRIREVSSGHTLSVLTLDGDEIQHLRWSDDGRRIAAASFTGIAAVWDVTTCTMTALDRTDDFMTGLDIAPDGSFTVGSFSTCGLHVWDASGRRIASLPSPEPSLFAELVFRAVDLSPDGSLVALGTRSGTLLLRAPSLAPVALVAHLARDEAAYVIELEGSPGTWPVPSGRFDAVGIARVPSVICRVGPHVLPMEVCEDRLFEPGLLADLVAR